VIIDYLQLMSSRGRAENRQVEVSEMSRSLKILARELQCPVIALSQLSRKLEERADKRPMMSDLRESGSLEQDADVVLFIFRPEQYGEVANDKKAEAEIIVARTETDRHARRISPGAASSPDSRTWPRLARFSADLQLR